MLGWGSGSWLIGCLGLLVDRSVYGWLFVCVGWGMLGLNGQKSVFFGLLFVRDVGSACRGESVFLEVRSVIYSKHGVNSVL